MEWNSVPHLISILMKKNELESKLWRAIKNSLIESAHDVSEGGLFVTLAESAFTVNLGFAVN